MLTGIIRHFEAEFLACHSPEDPLVLELHGFHSLIEAGGVALYVDGVAQLKLSPVEPDHGHPKVRIVMRHNPYFFPGYTGSNCRI